MAKSNQNDTTTKNVVKSEFSNSFADPATSNGAWNRYKTANSRKIQKFSEWDKNQKPKKNK